MKKNSTKGFTLAELLIVVAIIAVLVLIAIPVFTASLNRSKAATAEANARSLYAAMQADYLSAGKVGTFDKSFPMAGPGTLAYTSAADNTVVNKYEFSDIVSALSAGGGSAANDPVVVELTVTGNYFEDESGTAVATKKFGGS